MVTLDMGSAYVMQGCAEPNQVLGSGVMQVMETISLQSGVNVFFLLCFSEAGVVQDAGQMPRKYVVGAGRAGSRWGSSRIDGLDKESVELDNELVIINT